jgi:hypothetical protein
VNKYSLYHHRIYCVIEKVDINQTLKKFKVTIMLYAIKKGLDNIYAGEELFIDEVKLKMGIGQ